MILPGPGYGAHSRNRRCCRRLRSYSRVRLGLSCVTVPTTRGGSENELGDFFPDWLAQLQAAGLMQKQLA
jgi:hypothetical protein